MIRELRTTHPFARGRAFVDDVRDLQALVSPEKDARGREYQHVSVSGKGKLPDKREAALFLHALRKKGHINHEPRVETPSVVNPHVRHYVPKRLFSNG